jgi:arylsulfatase A
LQNQVGLVPPAGIGFDFHRKGPHFMFAKSCFFLTFRMAIVLVTLAIAADIRAADRPNVILILADDLAIGDLSCVNDGRSRTPRLDELRTQSVSFNQAYSGSPVCAPSRAALLTGRYPHRTGSVTLNQKKFPSLTRLKLSEVTIADRFQKSGYATALIGKWHSGLGTNYHPCNRGFDEFVGFRAGSDVETYFDFQLDVRGEIKQFQDAYLTDELTRHALEFVREHRDEPFFLHLAHYAPHRPLSAPESLVASYISAGLPVNTAHVYAMVEVLDRGIGRLLDELDELEISANTLVIFASDNGPDPLVGPRFNGKNRGTKYMVNEGGIHVPLMMRWQGVLEPGEREEVVHFTDLVPTLMEVCDLKPVVGEPLDGRSFAGLLSDTFGPTELPSLRFWQWNRGQPMYSHNAAVRQGDWKLVRPYMTRNLTKQPSNRSPKLYNLSQDPEEKQDLAADEPELTKRLLKQLDDLSRAVERDRVREE